MNVNPLPRKKEPPKTQIPGWCRVLIALSTISLSLDYLWQWVTWIPTHHTLARADLNNCLLAIWVAVSLAVLTLQGKTAVAVATVLLFVLCSAGFHLPPYDQAEYLAAQELSHGRARAADADNSVLRTAAPAASPAQ